MIDESTRLSALHALEVLDTPPEAVFDDLVRLASLACGTPIALVSLVDEDRQWFKAKVGLQATQTERSVAFCSVAIESPSEILLVEDATCDERFRDNPLVTGDPRVRFYAGAPIVSDEGQPLGTVCVIDHEPRKLDEGQLEILRLAGAQAAELLRLRRSELELARSVAEVAKRAEEIEQLLIDAQIHNESLERFARIISHDLRGPVRTMGSLASFAIEDLGDGRTEEGMEHLQRIVQRADRLELMHQGLLEYIGMRRPEDRGLVDVERIITELVENHTAEGNVDLETFGLAPLDTSHTMLTTILSNLVSNSIKHSVNGRVRIELGAAPEGNEIVYRYRDDGPGIPPEYAEQVFQPFATLRPKDEVDGAGLGLSLARRAAETMGGSLELEPSVVGVSFVLRLPSGG